MDIKNNTANIVSISRVFIAFIAIALLLDINSTACYIWATILTIIAFTIYNIVAHFA